MEGWTGLNYYTRNSSKWVPLMNLTTSEWGIGPLPPNLVAIPDQLNSTYSFPNGTLVIQDASTSTWGTSDIEKAIFGATSGLVLLWAAVWLFLNRAVFVSMLRAIFQHDMPKAGSGALEDGNVVANGGGSIHPGSVSTGQTAAVAMAELGAAGSSFISAREFKRKLRDFYYEPVQTELEMAEKDGSGDGDAVEVEDVEAVTALVRKMYQLDLGLWARSNAVEFSNAQRERYRRNSDAILAEVRRVISGWTTQNRMAARLAPEEWAFLQEVGEQMGRIPERRYGTSSPAVAFPAQQPQQQPPRRQQQQQQPPWQSFYQQSQYQGSQGNSSHNFGQHPPQRAPSQQFQYMAPQPVRPRPQFDQQQYRQHQSGPQEYPYQPPDQGHYYHQNDQAQSGPSTSRRYPS